MDGSHFDHLARVFITRRTRRTIMTMLGGLAAVPLMSTEQAAAKHKKHRKPCKAPKKTCGGKCLAIQSDDSNCGACGNRCSRTEICRGGQCEAVQPPVDCPIGQCCEDNQVCGEDGRCRDGQCQPLPTCLPTGGQAGPEDPVQCCSANRNCFSDPQVGLVCECLPGDAGNACFRNSDCRTGRCVGYQCLACPGEEVECHGQCVSLETDSNCGSCGNACDRDYYCQPQQNTMCRPRYLQSGNWPGLETTAVFVDETHTIFAVEDYDECVRQYSEAGTLEHVYGVCGQWGTDNRHFQAPSGAVAYGNLVYITDGFNHRVQIFARNGDYVGSLASGRGSGNYQVSVPAEMALDKDRNIYVADLENNRVQMFNKSGAYVRSFGTGVQGAGDNQLNQPAGVAVDKAGNVYVADWGNHRVQKFDSQGQYLRTFGARGTGPGQFDGPNSCAVTSTGDLFVVDGANRRVQQFAANGDVIRIFSGSPLRRPSGVAVDNQDNLYISDEQVPGVIRYQLQGPRPS